MSRDVKVLKSEKYDEQTKEMIFGKIVSSLSGISPHIKGEEGHFIDLGGVVMESDTPRQEAVEMYNIVAGFVEPIFSEHKGKIREEKAAIRKAELAKEIENCRPEVFNKGNKVDCMIVGLEREKRKVSLSIKALEIENEKIAIKKYGKGGTSSGQILGDILGKAFGSKKKGKKKEDKK